MQKQEKRDLYVNNIFNHLDELYTAAFHYCETASQAEGLVQKTCLNAWNQYEPHKVNGEFTSWIKLQLAHLAESSQEVFTES